MTNLKHKTPDARRTHRNRYVAAIQPVRELFGCTAAQAVGHVIDTLQRNKQLQAQLDKAQGELDWTKKTLEATKELANDLADELAKTRKNLTAAEEALAAALADKS